MVDVLVGSVAESLVDLAWSHDLVLWIIEELGPVSEPSSNPWDGEQDCEELSWDAYSLVDHTGVEVNIRV